MIKRISLALALVATFTIGNITQAQTRRQQPKRARTSPNASQSREAILASAAERFNQELVKFIDTAARVENTLKSNPSGSNLIELRTYFLTLMQSGAAQAKTDAPVMKAVRSMVDAYTDAQSLYGFATYKPTPTEELIRREEEKWEAERLETSKQVRDLRLQAYREVDLIKRDELRAEASAYESMLRYKNSIFYSEKQKKAAEARQREAESVAKPATLIVDKYGLRDEWAKDPLKAVNEIVNVGGKYRGVLERYLLEPSSIDALLTQVQQTLSQPTAPAQRSTPLSLAANPLVGTWEFKVSVQNGNSFTGTLTISQENNNYSGVLTLGTPEQQIPLNSVTVLGNGFAFAVSRITINGQTCDLAVSGNFEENRMAGKFTVGISYTATHQTSELTGSRR